LANSGIDQFANSGRDNTDATLSSTAGARDATLVKRDCRSFRRVISAPSEPLIPNQGNDPDGAGRN
jgi:hypothetical protein